MKNFNFKKSFKPGREFEEKTKNLYLSAFNEKFAGSATPAPSFAFNFVLRGAGVFAAILLLVTGTSTYAYGKNVGPNDILYPLKRYGETVRLSLTKESEKPAFHFKLAERRLEEIEKLKTANADSDQIQKAEEITADLKEEIKKSFLAPPQETAESVPPQPAPSSETQEGLSQPLSLSPQNQATVSQPTESATPAIQVISPNGGEVFGQGTPIKISWRTAAFSPKDRPYVHLYLRPYVQIDKEKGELGKIDANINCFRSLPYPINSFIWDGKTICANGKSYTINLPPSADYKIQARLYVRPDENPGKEKSYDESDATFSITDSKLTPSTKINPPVFGPPKDSVTEKETVKQNPIRENVIFPTNPKIAPGIKSEEKPQKLETPTTVLPKNQNQICKFVNDIIKKEPSGLSREIINDPEISSRIKENCEPQIAE